MRDLFTQDSNRFTKFSIDSGDLLFDYSKNLITSDTINLLIKLAEECGVKQAVTAMFSGEKINETEKRAVLHTALRNFSKRSCVSTAMEAGTHSRTPQQSRIGMNFLGM